METKPAIALGAFGTLLLGGLAFGLVATANAENQPAPVSVVATTVAAEPTQEPVVTETPTPAAAEPATVAEAPAPDPEPAPVDPAPVYVEPAPVVVAPVIVPPAPAYVEPVPVQTAPWAPVVVDANGAANGDPNNRASKD